MIWVAWWFGLLAFTFAVLEWGGVGWLRMRWAQGWLIPHESKRDSCRFQCGTCKEVT